MTVREYRRGDWAGVAELWRDNPPEEIPLFGLSPDAIGTTLRRLEGWGARFVLGFSRILGRPIVVILIVELEGRVRGTTILNFTRESGYVSGVVVDASVRRQGHARAMLQVCDDLCRRFHRPYVVLDVLSVNAPAIRLYDRWGYEVLRDVYWLACEFAGRTPAPAPTGSARIRPFQPRDGRALADLENAQMPPSVRAVVLAHENQYRLPRATRRVLTSESAAWVVESNGRAAGYLRATVSRLMQAANLTSPLFARDLPDGSARDLLLTALQWIDARKAPRVVVSLPDHEEARRPLLESLGFIEKFRIHTMVRRLPP